MIVKLTSLMMVTSVTAFTATTTIRHPYLFTKVNPTFCPSSSSLSLTIDDDEDSEEVQKKQPTLGIDIGAQLTPLTPEQAADLKAEATQTINEAFNARIDEIEALKTQVAKDFEKSKETLEYESNKRAREESSRLMGKIDALSNEFLEKNKDSRLGTKMAARADGQMTGSGLDVGSWGKIGGMDVLTDGGSGRVSSGGVLGSVGEVSAIAAKASATADGDDDEDVEERESRIMVVCDDKQDKEVQKVLNQFTTILQDKFPSKSIQIDNYKPTSVIPMGGNNAQIAIITSSSLTNGRQSAEALLSRILKRSLVNGKISTPPSHLVVISELGTERTEIFPYSMKNMMGGGKLNKMRDVEEVIISTVKGRMVADGGPGNVPLDYTIVKLGDIVQDSKVKKGKDNVDGSIQISPEDSLDGQTGIDAAANTLLQAITMQPNARNATLSVIGGLTNENKDKIDEYYWDDVFERLDGPELWRMENDDVIIVEDEGDANRVYEELTSFLGEWVLMYDNGAKGTGLTTPVSIVPSFLKKSMDTSITIQSKWGVRLEFKQTNTGSSYKSKSEERELEQQRPSSSSYSNNKPATIKTVRQKKEGGIEVLVEKVRVGSDGKVGVRARARRCNMDDFTVVKELSEETIVKRLQEAVSVWKKEVGR